MFRIGYEEETTIGSDSVVISTCWGSRSANPNNKKTSQLFIQNGCTADRSVIIRRNGYGAASDWKYQMFKWRQDRIYDYLLG